MGAVLTTAEVHDAFMSGPDHLIELFDGYTYSGNPIASAAGIATLDTYKEEGLFERAAALEGYWADAIHSLKGLPHVDRHPQYGPDRARWNCSRWTANPPTRLRGLLARL